MRPPCVAGWFSPSPYCRRNAEPGYWGFKDKGTTAVGRNRIRELLLLPIYRFRRPRHFLDIVFRRNTPIILAYSFPSLTVIAWWGLSTPEVLKSTLFADPVSVYAVGIILASAVAFIFTSMKASPSRWASTTYQYAVYSLER